MKNEYNSYIKRGEYIYCNNVKIRLLAPIGLGEEGIIYKTNTPYVCKIYKDDSLDFMKYKKIETMLQMRVRKEGICWPLAMALDEKGRFVGYLMNRAWGREMKESIFDKKYLTTKFPDWTKIDTVNLSLTILDKIQYLHENNIIIGDINDENILVVSSKEVYFVDTDSYQVNGIPCPVGTELFTAPEIGSCVFCEILRSYGNEYFAVATLIFMIMMLGMTPYLGKRSQEIIRNIKRMEFPYYLNDRIDLRVKENSNIYMWSHLPNFLKEAFYVTFNRGGKHSHEETRYTTEEWIYFMQRYKYLLHSGTIRNEDEISEELFPNRNKK